MNKLELIVNLRYYDLLLDTVCYTFDDNIFAQVLTLHSS